jgi:ECF-type riboflavin transporter, S component
MQASSSNRTRLVVTAAICAALYTIVNALTSLIPSPFGIGEFRPGIVIPIFFAMVSGPLPAAIGAATGSFIADMLTLVPQGHSTILWALGGGALGNFVGIYAFGIIFDKLKTWRGFIIGTSVGLFLGNLVAAAGVVFLGMFFLPVSSLNTFPGMTGNMPLALGILVGLLLFWFGTMFPFAVILDPLLVRALRPYASQLSVGRSYPEISNPSNKVVWTWSIVVSLLVLAALVVAIFSGIAGITAIVSGDGGNFYWSVLFIVSAIAVIVVGMFLPKATTRERQIASPASSSS